MVEETERKKKRVIGHRLTYLSRHEGVRQAILDGMRRGEELTYIVTHLDVDGVKINVHEDQFEAFKANLNDLEQGLGDEYAGEPDLEDTKYELDYLWSKWETSVERGGTHYQKLREAVESLLGSPGRVDVTGEYIGNKRDVLRVDSPKQLIFRAKENEDPGLGGLKGGGGDDDEPDERRD
jgi:hypothetical protein